MISIVCKQHQCLTRNPSKLWGLKLSYKTNRKTLKNTVQQNPLQLPTLQENKVRCCKNTWVCKQTWTIMKWIIESFRLFAAPPPQGSSSQWAERVVTRTRFIITGLILQSTHTLSHPNPARRRSQSLASSFTLITSSETQFCFWRATSADFNASRSLK